MNQASRLKRLEAERSQHVTRVPITQRRLTPVEEREAIDKVLQEADQAEAALRGQLGPDGYANHVAVEAEKKRIRDEYLMTIPLKPEWDLHTYFHEREGLTTDQLDAIWLRCFESIPCLNETGDGYVLDGQPWSPGDDRL